MKLLVVLLVFFSISVLAAEALPLHAVKDAQGKLYYTGRIPHPDGKSKLKPSQKYLIGAVSYPKTLNRDLSKLSQVLNQGSCGSCVYFGVTSTWLDTMILRGQPSIVTSPQYLMDCAERRHMCGGSLFEYVGPGLAKKGGAPLLSEYPYEASNQSCQGEPTLHGKALEAKLIDNSPKSIIGALNDARAVAVTIGAGGSFMNYKSGIFSSCSGVRTNHQVELVDYNCESAIDAQGNCVFDAEGKLPEGVGYWVMRNSWGTGWGDHGWIKIKITDSSGSRCNNIAEEAGIIEVGDPLPPPGPKVFAMESQAVTLKVTLSQDALATPTKAKQILQPFVDNLK